MSAADRVNHAAIEEAAISLAFQLSTDGHAEFILEPDDGTQYPIVILPPGRFIPRSGDRVDIAGTYQVTLSWTKSYPWNGDHMSGDYCAEKWGDDNRWTGDVMAMLLSALSDELRKYV